MLFSNDLLDGSSTPQLLNLGSIFFFFFTKGSQLWQEHEHLCFWLVKFQQEHTIFFSLFVIIVPKQKSSTLLCDSWFVLAPLDIIGGGLFTYGVWFKDNTNAFNHVLTYYKSEVGFLIDMTILFDWRKKIRVKWFPSNSPNT